jgi:FAD/FMN-containing dehydrogenase
MSDIVTALLETLGEDAVLRGEDVSSRQSGFFSRSTVKAKAIVRPRSTEEVSKTLRLCHEFGQPVVAHGGLTGLVQGAVTSPDDVAISLELMNQIEEINATDRTVVVQSGVILQTLQEAVEEYDMMYPLDLGGRGSCTIGGNISTNAGGNRVIRYGMTRDMVLGLEAVLADGTVVSSMNQMIKNNAGYDLKHMFIGSEGSLGIVTRAVLRLRETPRARSTLMVAVDEFEKLPRLLKYLDSSLGGTLSAFELMWNNYYRLVTTEPARNTPPMSQDYPYYVLIEAIGTPESRAEEILEAAWGEELIVDAVVASSEAQRMDLWAIRDDVGQMGQFAPTFTFDVSLRISKMVDYVDEVNRRLEERFPNVVNFALGHMGDGNLHFIVATGEGDNSLRHDVEACVYEPLAAINGSVSAEHGVGLEKKAWLGVSRSGEEIALMRTMKQALDPKGILNPGKIFDATAQLP